MIKKLMTSLNYCLLLFLLISIPEKGMAQLRNVIGVVTDAKTGRPIPGVSIKVKRSNEVVVTNTSGKYGVRVRNTDVLTFSIPGYVTRGLAVGVKTTLNVPLRQEENGMNEPVEIGYGTTLKSILPSVNDKVVTDDLIKAPVGTFLESMAGRSAGVQVSSTNGQPGTTPDVVIRGVNSFFNNTNPLYVIDGTPVEKFDLAAINPEEIQTINVLKDAAATAIYGSRGSNGVILIVTKRGNIGRTVVNFNTTVGIQQAAKKIDMMSPFDFVRYQLEVDENAAKETYATAELDPTFPLYNANGRTLSSYQNNPGINWQDELFRNAPLQIHNLAIRGGDAKTRYSISGSMLNQEGIILNSDATRYQGRASLDQTINDKARVGITINYSRNNRFGETATNNSDNFSTYSLYRAWGYRPVSGSDLNLLDENIDPLYNANPDLRINPVAAANNAFNNRGTQNFFANAYLELDLFKNLQFRTTGTISTMKNRQDIFNNSLTTLGNIGDGANGSFHYMTYKNIASENTLTYTNTFNADHKLTLLAGFSYYKNKDELFGYYAINLPQEEFGIYGLSEGQIDDTDSDGGTQSVNSYYARADYSYKSKYILSLTSRTDEYLVGDRSHHVHFPAAAVAWNMAGESFMSNLKAISLSKLRASYGISGNLTTGTDQVLYSTYIPSNPVNSLMDFYDPVVRNENTRQFNVGYDLGLFNNRIALTFDYYKKETGYNRDFTMISNVENSGYEFSLNTMNVQSKSFNWTSSFNISFNKNKIVGIGQMQNAIYSKISTAEAMDPLYVAQVGQPMGMFYGYTFNGNYQVEDFNQDVNGQYSLKPDLPGNGSLRAGIQPGHVRYEDLNDDGIIDFQDKGIIGRSLPKHFGGFTNNLTYKNFGLNVLLQWMSGHQIYNANRAMFEGNSSLLDVNQFASYNNRWTAENRSNEYHAVGGQGPQGFQSSKYLEDGSYLRLKTVSFSYSIPPAKVKSLYLTNLKLFVSGQNLLTFTNYTGLDPEVSARQSSMTPGFDYSAYPQARTVSFGINATF
jgi:TonB-linked SusC/RagA family outer membrane protein